MNLVRAAPVIVLVGCAEASAPSASVEITGARVVPVSAALADVTRAQCARAQACGAIASFGIYRDASYCDELSRRTLELVGRDCSYADAAVVDACVRAVRAESCTAIAQTARPPPICRRLCVSP